MSDPSHLLSQMARRSERKLRRPRNLAKGSWLSMTDAEVKARIRDEIVELHYELEGNDWEAIADEAADVYHFASMGADPKRRSKTEV